MTPDKPNKKGGAMRGVLCALVPSWALLMCAGGLTFWTMASDDAASPWIIAPIVALWLTIFPAIAFGSGLICAYFWQPIIEGENYRKWSAWATLGVFAPTLLGLCAGLMVLTLIYLPGLWLFNWGVEQGLDWWPRQRWRHFFGFTNDWERDTDET